MSSPNARKNIKIKKQYMSKRFGLFKACVKLCLQRKSFLDMISVYNKSLKNCFYMTTNTKKSITNKYFDAYYYNTDLWVDNIRETESFSKSIPSILFETNSNIIEPIVYFYKHLSRLGFLCRYVLPDIKSYIKSDTCDIPCDEYLCTFHLNFRYNCITEINKLKIPDVLIKLIIDYAFTFY